MGTSWLIGRSRGFVVSRLPSSAKFLPFLVLVLIGSRAVITRAGDDGATNKPRATLEATGAGTKTIDWGPDEGRQTISYNYSLSFKLQLRLLDVQGDITRYTIIGQEGSVHFWGTAEDIRPWSQNGFNFDIEPHYTQSVESGVLHYSATKHEVVYVDLAVNTMTGIQPYRVEYFGYVHPHSARLWIKNLGPQWYFDDIYEGCSVGVGADFTTAQIRPYGNGTYVSYDGNFSYNSVYGGSWRMVGLDTYLLLIFDLPVAPEAVTLVFRHLTSAYAACPGGGYSPITILVNGQPVVQEYDPAANHGGTHDYVIDTWEIGPYLKAGRNQLKIARGTKPCTHYWISNLDVRVQQPQPDCATCLLLGLPTLIVVIPGVHSGGAEMEAPARALSDRACDLFTISEDMETEDIPNQVAVWSRDAITNEHDLIINVDTNLDDLLADITRWDKSTDWAGHVANIVSEEFTQVVPVSRRVLFAHSAGGDAVSKSLQDSGGKKLYDDINILHGRTSASDLSSRLATCGYSWAQTKIFTSQGDIWDVPPWWPGGSTISNMDTARDKALAGAWVHLHCTKVWVGGPPIPIKPCHNTLRDNYNAPAEFELHDLQTTDGMYVGTFIGAMCQDWTSR